MARRWTPPDRTSNAGKFLRVASDGQNVEWATVPSGYTNEEAQDAIGGILDNGTVGDVNFTYDDATPKISGVIKNDAITFAKFQNITDSRLLGRSAGSSGDMQELTVGSGLILSAGSLSLNATGDWTGTFDGQEGSYYLARANHTGTQLAATISDFQSTVSANTDVAASKVKTDWITVTQAVDLDTIETRVNALDAAVVLMGGWDASAGTFPGGGTAQAGASYIVTVAGTVDSVSFSINDRLLAITDNASTTTYASNWLKLDYTDQVLSVFGRTGAVTAQANDYTWAQINKATSSLTDITTRSHADLQDLTTGDPHTQYALESGSIGVFTTKDHDLLTGLTDDDHTQYALLAGRSGGQTLIGGTASGNDLTLQSTSHATKGNIFFGTLSTYDEVNDRLGLGTLTPSAPLHVLFTSGTLFPIYDLVANDAFACTVAFRKARGTVGSLAAVQNGDVIGSYQTRAHDGSGYVVNSSLRAKCNGTVVTGFVPTDLEFINMSGSASTINMVITANGNIVAGAQAALATNATNGFLYIPTQAGAPTGAPTAYTGKVAMTYDTTNQKLYIYSGAWRSVTLA